MEVSLKNEILRRLDGIESFEGVGGDFDKVATALCTVAVELLAGSNKPELSDVDKRLILENYPAATEDLMSQRSMTDLGVVKTVVIASTMARIATEYNPSSNIKAIMDRDLELPEESRASVQDLIQNTLVKSEGSGLSIFGIVTMMILIGSQYALTKGVNRFQLSRTILDALSMCYGVVEQPTPEELESQLLDHLCEQMGISKKEAKKYMALAKSRM